MDLEANAAGKQQILTSETPLVARRWFGRTRIEHADEYLRYNHEQGVLEVEKKPGCLGMQQFRKIRGDVAEFNTISYWESVEAMEAAHGEGLRPTHLHRDPDYLLELPGSVEVSELHVNDWLLEVRDPLRSSPATVQDAHPNTGGAWPRGTFVQEEGQRAAARAVRAHTRDVRAGHDGPRDSGPPA